MVKLISCRNLRTNYIYTIKEAAKILGCNPKTIQDWKSKGLPVCGRMPTLLRGKDIKDFVNNRRKKKVRHCGSNELFLLFLRGTTNRVRDKLFVFPRSIALEAPISAHRVRHVGQ